MLSLRINNTNMAVGTVGSPKMNSTQKSGCDNNKAVNISSISKSESNKDDLVSKRWLVQVPSLSALP